MLKHERLHKLQHYCKVNNSLLFQCYDLYYTAEYYYNKSKTTYRNKVKEQNKVYERENSMASDQTVPNPGQDTYEEIASEIMDVYTQLINIHATMDRLLIKAKQSEDKVKRMNRIELLVNKYNNLS